MDEIWKDVKDYEGLYQISNYGRVKRLSKQKRNYNINTKKYDTIILPDKIVTPQLNQYGYYRIGLTKNGKRKCHSVHKLVAQAFIPNPENKPQINHKDENKQNNYVENLEWCTAKYNINYGTRNKRTGQKQMKPILCVETGVIYESLSEASKSMELSMGNISCVCRHRKWFKTAGGYHWEYVENIKPERKTRKKKVID